jgi:hypothetical protein
MGGKVFIIKEIADKLGIIPKLPKFLARFYKKCSLF